VSDIACAVRPARRIRPDALLLCTCAAIALGMVLRLVARAKLPLWFDETGTGSIAAEPSFGQFLQQVLGDVNAPLYYVVMHAWVQLFGLSNEALRLPSVLFGALAPLIALLPSDGTRREERLLWCALLSLWIPGLYLSQDARCHTLLLFLCGCASVAFLRLLDHPSLGRAAIWAALGSLAILTHYHAIFLIGCQGIAYLIAHRGRALRTWPAALLFLPAFGWILIHAPRIAQYADPAVAWYPLLTPIKLSLVIGFILGEPPVIAILALLGAIALTMPKPLDHDPKKWMSNAWILVGASAAALSIVVALGFLRPSFALRYLVPFAPGLLLGLAMTLCRLGERFPPAPMIFLLSFAAAAGIWSVAERRVGESPYNLEIASKALMASNVRNLVFLWDHPGTPIQDPRMLAGIGGFFFRRAGLPVAVTPMILGRQDDPNPRLVDAASRPDSGILWIYDLEVQGTVARAHPPRIASHYPGWRCRDFGRDRIGVIACDKPPAR
jgi:uncharacterized membrane protein